MPFDASSVVIDDRFLGDGYPLASAAGQEAVHLFAREEGLLLDQVYGGKAAAAAVAYAQTGELAVGKRILFIHTGGNAGLYY